MPIWLERAGVPLFVSHRRLAGRRTLPRAIAPWALDSGGFSELDKYDRWRTTPQTYAAAVQRYSNEIGNLQWAAIQDWMCEPWLIAKTGLSIAEHQARTIDSWFDLHELAPDLPWLPVLQGWTGRDYQRHFEQWARRGVDLARLPLVGIGSVCRRQGTREGVDLFRLMSWFGIRLHGFGVKTNGLRMGARYLASADSMAWSYGARREKQCLPSHTHKNGANCMPFALQWRDSLVGSLLPTIGTLNRTAASANR
jgi:hypothetical protein